MQIGQLVFVLFVSVHRSAAHRPCLLFEKGVLTEIIICTYFVVCTLILFPPNLLRLRCSRQKCSCLNNQLLSYMLVKNQEDRKSSEVRGRLSV